MVTRFVKFEVPNSQQPIFVNRSKVRTVRVAGANSKNVTLAFDGEHHATVVGSAEEAVQKLED